MNRKGLTVAVAILALSANMAAIPADAAEQMVTIGGEQLATNTVLGRKAATPDGIPFARVTAVERQKRGAMSLILRITQEHRANGDGYETPATSVPMIAGNGFAEVSADQVRLADDGRTLIVEEGALQPFGGLSWRH